MDSAISNESLLQVDQSSRFKRKLTFFISLIIIFTFVITAIISVFAMLKHSIDSQSLAANPPIAIRAVCYLTSPYSYSTVYVSYNPEIFTVFEDDSISRFLDPDLCINSISSLHINSSSKTNPSKIFALSLLAAIKHLTKITSSTTALLPKLHNLQHEPAVLNCTYLINNSLTHLTRSLTKIGVDPDENILKDKKIIGEMKTWITAASYDLKTCLEGFKKEESGKMGVSKVRFEANMARRYVANSLFILENVDSIFDMFYPPIGSVLGSFLMTIDSFFSLGLFCSQLLFVAALFAVLLRLHRR